jgi:hypothetical protein
MIESYSSVYKLNFPKYWLVKDEPSARLYSPAQDNNYKSFIFHIDNDDYLSTLATILGFFEESINNNDITPEMREIQLKVIRNVIGEVLYLSKYYNIVPKNNGNKF